MPGAPHCQSDWPWQHLVGNFHNHTIAKPDDHPFTHGYRVEAVRAREVGLEIFGLSDHDQDLDRGLAAEQRAFARAESRVAPPFVVLAGWEWTVGALAPWRSRDVVAHINGFGAVRIICARPKGNLNELVAENLDAFYRLAAGESRGRDVVFQFNHPWAGSDHFRLFRRPANWAALYEAFALCEVDSGLSDCWRQGIAWFGRALQEGWRVAPAAGNDTYGGVIRASRARSTGVWADANALAREPQQAVLAALRARRCYARKSAAVLRFGVASAGRFAPMGEKVAVADDGHVTIECQLTTPSQFRAPRLALYLVRPGTIERRVCQLASGVQSEGVIVGQATLAVPPETICCYLGFQDGSEALVSAPVWLTWPTPMLRPPSINPAELQQVFKLGDQFRLEIAMSAEKHQRLVLRRDGRLFKTYILTRDGQRRTFRFVNRRYDEVSVSFEAAHRGRSDRNWQPTRLVKIVTGAGWVRYDFEDGDDTDYNDLIVEIYRE